MVDAPPTVALMPPGLEVTVKLSAGEPAGVHVTMAESVPADAVTPVGAPGGEVGPCAALGIGAARKARTANTKAKPIDLRKFLPLMAGRLGASPYGPIG